MVDQRRRAIRAGRSTDQQRQSHRQHGPCAYSHHRRDGGRESPCVALWRQGQQGRGAAAAYRDDDRIPNGLESTAIRAGLDGDTITDPTGYVFRTSKDVPLSLGLGINRTLTIKVYGLRSTLDDEQMEGNTTRQLDISRINGKAKRTIVYNTTDGEPSAPMSPDSSLQLIAGVVEQINQTKSRKVFYFEPNSEIEKIIFGRAKATADSSNLTNTCVKGAVFTTGAEPNIPAVSGLVFRTKEVMPIVSANTSNLSVIFWQYGETTPAEDERFKRSRNTFDPNDIESENLQASIVATGSTGPSSGFVGSLTLIDYADTPLTSSSASNLSIRVLRFGKLDSLDKEIVPKLNTTIDLDGSGGASSIEDSGIRVKAWKSSDAQPAEADDPLTNNTKVVQLLRHHADQADQRHGGDIPARVVFKSMGALRAAPTNCGWARRGRGIATRPVRTRAGWTLRPWRAALDGDPALPTTILDANGVSLVITETVTHPLSYGLSVNRTLTVNTYGIQNKKQELENRETQVQITPLVGYDYEVATLVPWMGDALSLAIAVQNANLGDVTYRGVQVRKTNPNQAIQKIRRSNDDRRIRTMTGLSHLVSVRGVPTGMVDGSGNSTAQHSSRGLRKYGGAGECKGTRSIFRRSRMAGTDAIVYLANVWAVAVSARPGHEHAGELLFLDPAKVHKQRRFSRIPGASGHVFLSRTAIHLRRRRDSSGGHRLRFQDG